MKKIPNIITISRMILSIVILFTSPNSILFIGLYITCGLSDIADGLIARRFSLESALGAKLDSISDMIFVAVVFFKLLPLIKVSQFILFWIILIAMIRLTSLLIVKLKFRSFGVLHTYLNKLTGITLFLIPIAYHVVEEDVFASIICIIGSIAALEEMIIHLSSSELSLDNKGLWIKRMNRQV